MSEKCNCCNEEEVSCSTESGCCGHDHENEDNGITKDIVILSVSLIALVVSFIELPWIVFKYINPAWIAVILCGFPIFASAISSIKQRKITSSILITVAIIASIVLEFFVLSGTGESHEESYIFAAGEIAFLMALGELLEALTVRKSRAGINRLVNLAPKTAFVKRFGITEEINIKDVKIGDIVVVKPDDMVSVDGVIVSGSTSVDQSSVTGESVPVDKFVGDNVYGGTWNKQGAIEIEVTKEPKDMTVSKLIELALEAEGKKAPISRVADKWAGYIVPSAIGLSIIIFLISYFAFNVGLVEAIIRGVTILVVFCPCALTLATPTAIAAGLGVAAKNGILVKSGSAIEEMAKIDTIAFDKTGTLTKGKLKVFDSISYGMDKAKMMDYAASAEEFSQHPIAKAIIDYVGEIKYHATDVNAIAGTGTTCIVNGHKVEIGKLSYFQEKGFKSAEGTQWLGEGKTVIGIEVDNELKGIIALGDTIKEDAPSAVADLTNLGYETLILTGDNEFAANIIAKQTGITRVIHSLLPHEKLEQIKNYQGRGKKVCMIGDGVNDAPSLATANCGIAMSTLGSEAAIETADIALMTDNLKKLPWLFKKSKKILNTIKVNIMLSMLINIIAVVLSTMGVLNPVTGALIHNVSSILVVLNSSALLISKK